MSLWTLAYGALAQHLHHALVSSQLEVHHETNCLFEGLLLPRRGFKKTSYATTTCSGSGRQEKDYRSGGAPEKMLEGCAL